MVSRNFSASLINEALGTSLTQLDVITVSSMEDEAVAQVVGQWNAMPNTKHVSCPSLLDPGPVLLSSDLKMDLCDPACCAALRCAALRCAVLRWAWLGLAGLGRAVYFHNRHVAISRVWHLACLSLNVALSQQTVVCIVHNLVLHADSLHHGEDPFRFPSEAHRVDGQRHMGNIARCPASELQRWLRLCHCHRQHSCAGCTAEPVSCQQWRGGCRVSVHHGKDLHCHILKHLNMVGTRSQSSAEVMAFGR